MTMQEYVAARRGGRSLRKYAEHLGVGVTSIHSVLEGTRGVGRFMLDRLIAAYPDDKARLIALFFAQGCHSSDVNITVGDADALDERTERRRQGEVLACADGGPALPGGGA